MLGGFLREGFLDALLEDFSIGKESRLMCGDCFGLLRYLGM